MVNINNGQGDKPCPLFMLSQNDLHIFEKTRIETQQNKFALFDQHLVL